MICMECGQEYDRNMFPRCPFCLCNPVALGKEECNEVIVDDNISEIIINEVINSEVKDDNLCASKDMLVIDYFYENVFNTFVKYCEKNNITYMSELSQFDLENLEYIKGLDKGKIEKIITRYEGYFKDKNYLRDKEKIKEDCIFININKDLEDLSLKALRFFGLLPNTYRKLINEGYNTIGDLREANKNKIIDIVGKNNGDKILKIQEYVKMDIISILKFMLDYFRENETDRYEVLIMRAYGCTLQEIAEDLGVTREAVRQRVKKITTKMQPYIEKIVSDKINIDGFYSVKELKSFFYEDEYNQILFFICKEIEGGYYLDFADVIVYENNLAVEYNLMSMADTFIGEGINLYEHFEELELFLNDNGYVYIGIDEFIKLIIRNGYKFYGDFVFKGTKSYGYLCEKIIAREFPAGIKLYEGADLKKLRERVLETYGDLGLPDSDRALSARVSEYLVLCDRGKFIAPENIIIDMNILKDIKEYIDKSSEAKIFYTELYANFEGILLMTSNINNYNFLHGILKLYYPECYDYTAKDYLLKKDGKIISINERIKDYILSKGRAVSKSELKNKLIGFSDVMIANAITEDESLIQWQCNYYNCLDVIKYDENIKNVLCSSLRSITNSNKGYCNEKMLYENVKLTLKEFIEVNNIRSASNLFYICSKLFNNLYIFRRPHIMRTGILSELSLKNIMLYLLEDTRRISYNQYMLMANKFKIPDITASMAFSEVENEYFRVSEDSYIKRELINFDDSIINEIEKVIVGIMKNDILALMNFNEWDMLPDIEYIWNQYLLNSIIKEYSKKFRIIEPQFNDRRYVKGILVYNDSKFKKFTDIIKHIMNLYNISEITEIDMYSFLVVHGFAHKVIPRDIYDDRDILYERGKFIIRS